MDPERWRQVDAIFQSALERAAGERSAFLAAACAGDSQLVVEVKSLLAAEVDSHDFLETPTAPGLWTLLETDAAEAIVGRRIGAYRIVRTIASGGMGVVYLAVRADDQYEKRVAIKVLKQGLATPELVERFRIERQTLAGLEHPSISRLIDGGVMPDGRPYYVMEYVDGQPIDRYCDTAGGGGLDLRRRLELFSRVCAAVHFAHQNLVLHRDLKPSNILIVEDAGGTGSGGTGRPILLDFGLAKPLGAEISMDAVGQTTAGQFMGTMAYAAPEQIRGDRGRMDTRSDVYALGVILYHMVSNVFPYSVSEPLAQVLESITTIEPPAPSAHDPRLDDEIDAIVLKALAKDQPDRYQSAAALQEDVERYLAGEPVIARQEYSRSNWYLLRKTARRYRIALAVSLAFVALITVFAAIMAVQTGRARQQRDLAETRLYVSNVERGRSLAQQGQTALGEEMIWHEFLRDRDVTANIERLDRYDPLGAPPNLAYWALWELYSGQPCVRTMPLKLKAVSMAASGDVVVAGDGHGDIWIVDVLVGTRRRCGHHDGVCVVAISPGGETLASGSITGSVNLWNVDDGRLIAEWTTGTFSRYDIRFSPDGRTAAVQSKSGALELRDARTGEIVRSFQNHSGAITSIAFSPDGRFVLTAGTDSTIAMTELATGETSAIDDGCPKMPSVVRFSRDGRYFATACWDFPVTLWKTDGLIRIAVMQGHSDVVASIDFHPSEPLAATGAGDSSVMLWSLPDARTAAELKGHTGPVQAVGFVADDEQLVSTDRDSCKVWDLKLNGCMKRVATPPVTIFDVCYSDDGRHVAFAGGVQIDRGESAIGVVDLSSGEVVADLKGHAGIVADIQFVDGSQRLYSTGYDGTIRGWDVAGGTETVRIEGHHGRPVNSIAANGDATVMASAGDDGVVNLWDARSHALMGSVEIGQVRLPSVRFSPDGRRLAAIDGTLGEVIVMDVNTRSILRRWRGHDVPGRSIAFSPDGALLATGADDNCVRLWDAETAESLGTLRGHDQDVFTLAFSGNGRFLASAGRDGKIKLWDVAKRSCLVTLDGHSDMIFSVTFSPDGRSIASGGRDGSACVWDLGYFHRHVVGNLEYQSLRLRSSERGGL